MAKRMTLEEKGHLHESIAQAILTVIDNRRRKNPEISLDWLTQPNKKVPDGFWGDVREILNKDGITRPSGGQWAEDTHLSVQYVLKSGTKEDIYSRVCKWLNIEVKHNKSKENKRRKKSVSSSQQDKSESQQAQQTPDIHNILSQLVDDVRSIKEQRAVPPVRPDKDDTWDEPVFPPHGFVETERVNADINIVLFNLLEKERKRQGGNRSKALQIILWRGLGRPSLFPEKTDE